MKKSILTFASLFVTLVLFAQDKQRSIEIIGETAYEKVIEKYTVEIIVSEALVYDNYNNETPDFSEIKKTLFDKLNIAGIPSDRLKENKLGYLSSSYRKRGMMYTFETLKKEEFLSFLAVRSKGTQIQSKKIMFKDLSNDQKRELISEAINDCKTKALLIATSLNQNLGAIIHVRDSNYNTKNKEVNYYNGYDVKGIYYLTLKYELK